MSLVGPVARAVEDPAESAPRASLPADSAEAGEISFSRPDWTLFRSVATLPQRTGVSPDLLRRLVVKELADNALDSAGDVRVEELQGGGYVVEDDGPGVAPERLPELFSIARPLVSSKALRLPRRGALGNGLRVVAGAVLGSAGTLVVETRGQRVTLAPRDDGGTDAASEPCGRTGGMRVEVVLGDAIPADRDGDPLAWTLMARLMAGRGTEYCGRSSAWWYGPDDVFELLQAAGSRSVRDLVQELDGCSGAKAGRVAASYLGRAAASLSRNEAAELLGRVRSAAREVAPRRLGAVRDLVAHPWYARRDGVYELGGGRGARARVPFVLEAWGRPSSGGGDEVAICVNRTPVAGALDVLRRTADRETRLWLFGCGLEEPVPVARTTPPMAVVVNLTAPVVPITTDGKQPDLGVVAGAVGEAVGAVGRRARRSAPPGAGGGGAKKDMILGLLEDGVEKASGGGAHRFTLRQLWYVIRPPFQEALGEEPGYPYFSQVVNAHEHRRGYPIPGCHRNPRGTLYIPHARASVALGSLAVEQYRHPAWTFNKVCYIEKEGFFDVLKHAEWPEKHDCALLTSQGQATGAARDLLDLLGEVGEDIRFYCVHDADGYGTAIYEALVRETRARGARRVEVVNLGLEPAEAVGMGLEVEDLARGPGARRVAVASYVGPEWADWLQRHRIELNAMTTPEFVGWLDRKLEEHGQGRLVPPADVLGSRLEAEAEASVRARLTERVLAEADIEGQVAAEMHRLRRRLASRARGLGARVRRALAAEPARSWSAAVVDVAAALGSPGGGRKGRRGGGNAR